MHSNNGENSQFSGENGNDASHYGNRGKMVGQAIKQRSDDQNTNGLEAQQEIYQKEIVERLNQKLAEMKKQQSDASSPNRSSAGKKGNVSPDTANRIEGKMKGNPGLKGFLAVGALVGLTAAISFVAMSNNNSATVEDEFAAMGFEQWGETSKANALTGYEVLDSTIDGSYQQYDNIGCYNSEGKVSDHAVGNPNKVLEAMGINPEEATAEQRGAVQEYFAYCMEEPAASVAIAGSFAGFEGLTQGQAEDRIHNMTPEEKLAFQAQEKSFFDVTSYHYDTGKGLYRNQSIVEDDNGNKYTKFVESDLTGKEILVGETKLSDDATIYWMSKEDCGNNEDQIVVVSSDGSQHTIIIDGGSAGNESAGNESAGNESAGNESAGNESAGNESAGNESAGNESAGNEGTGNEGTGNEGTGDESTGYEDTGDEGTNLTPKNTEAEIQNAGKNVDQQELNQEVTPPTDIKQDEANFEAIEAQHQQDEAAKAEAAAVAAQQAEAERQAAAEAEQRRQQEEAAAAQQAAAERQAAEQEAARAAAAEQEAARQAAAEQAAAAEAERQAAAEQAAREQEQREADARAAEQAAAAAAQANNTQEQRAEDFANGNF